MDRFEKAGAFQVHWDGKDAAGQAVPSGLYFYKLETPSFSEVQKMIMIE